MRELIDDGYLCPYKVWTVPHQVDYSNVTVGSSGEYVHAKLVAAEDCDKKLVGNIVDTYLKRVPGKRAICFMSSVKKAEETAEAFRQAGVPSVAVDGTSSDEERERATEDLADDKIKVLVNCDLVGEGVDVPAVEVVIMGTRTASFVRFTQWWGRMLRLALSEAARNGYDGLSAAGRRQRIAESEKPFGIVIDHGGNLIQHNGPPDLRTEPWSLDARQRRNTAGAEAIPYRVCPNYMELEAGLTWEQVRALGMSDAQLREAGMGWKAPNNWSCATPYAATNRCCPACGYMPLPISRSAPQEVDGDLQLLDAEALLALLNHGITPRVPSQGSVGYLTHMAHVGVALLGIGEVSYRGEVVPAFRALAAEGLEPVQLGAKDGLCLVNGTPCMTGLSCLALDEATRLAQWADVIGAMSFEALRGQIDAFDAEIIALKPHPGMQKVGANLRALLEGSEVIASSRGIRTQDALSIRSMPQIHGACRDQLEHAAKQIEKTLPDYSVAVNDSYARDAMK